MASGCGFEGAITIRAATPHSCTRTTLASEVFVAQLNDYISGFQNPLHEVRQGPRSFNPAVCEPHVLLRQRRYPTHNSKL